MDEKQNNPREMVTLLSLSVHICPLDMDVEIWGKAVKRLRGWAVYWLEQEKENSKSDLSKDLRRMLKEDIKPAIRRYRHLCRFEFMRLRDFEEFKSEVWYIIREFQSLVNDHSSTPFAIIR